MTSMLRRLDKLAPDCDISCVHGGLPNPDCTTCVNCTGGWSGVDCNSCGECQHGGVMTDRQQCVCSRCRNSWAGPMCAMCGLQCQHGGQPNADCSGCESCLVGWTGQVCETFDDVGDLSPLEKYVVELADKARQSMEDMRKRPRPPLPGEVGTGIDTATGELRLPVVKLNYDSNRTWTNPEGQAYTIPSEVIYEEVLSKYSPKTVGWAFWDVFEFQRVLSSWQSDRSAFGGVFAYVKSLFDINSKYFTATNSLLLVQRRHGIYELSLPYTESKARKYAFDEYCQRAIDYLPSDYSSANSRKLYRLFIDTWGTHYTTRSTLGGILEFSVLYAKTLITASGFRSETLLQEGINMMQLKMNPNRPDTVNPTFKAGVEALTVKFIGGSLAAEMVDASRWREWVESIPYAPLQLEMEYSSIAELIQDPAKRAAMQQAIGEYLTEMGQKREDEEDKIRSGQ
eukprot:GILK01003645.1.p1 GENE.GILK01003645.1~~GILK01003645.1.p1  ORF type:complete len:533 (-),score=63.55 GILK01003645.1:125-1489(-)